MFIATLPAVHQRELIERIVSCDAVDGVRFNVGVSQADSPRETLEQVLELAERYNKKFWLDLKGRQLRITQWAAPIFGKIVLNHEVEVDVPARICFRGNEYSEVKVVRGNTIYVDPPPPKAVGGGQAVNILGKNLAIKGYLTDDDREYLASAKTLGVKNFMLSFVESAQDTCDVARELGEAAKDARMVLKIESPKGLAFVASGFDDAPSGCTLMAARDDMFINIGDKKFHMIHALRSIIDRDPNAICASRIFSGIEQEGMVTMGDISDIVLMRYLGYKHFMLSDGVCNRHFDAAIEAWHDIRMFLEKENLWDE